MLVQTTKQFKVYFCFAVCYNEFMNKIYTIEEIKNILNDNKDYFAEKYNVNNFLLFGSYAKNLQTEESDIDLLVNFTKPVDMFDFVDIQEYLTKIFNKKIDLGTVNGLKSFVKDSILKEALTLWRKKNRYFF